MKMEQIYTGCLAQGAYYIESKGEAAVIDPLREVEYYIRKAEKNNAKIKYVLETHFHADFVSGHIDLAKETGATIVYGPTAKPSFAAHIATDGEELKLGEVTIKILHTPGHTMESCCYLLKDHHGKDKALFSGDTLFIGDVGRPDLAQKLVAELTQDKLAGLLYDSLRNKIMPLGDDIIVYPAHGAGSACGKNMSKETSDTLGHQKKTNYALRADMTKEEFVKALLDGLVAPPQYFPQNVLMNIKGYESIKQVITKGKRPLSANEFEAEAEESSAVIIDTRPANVFAKGFIPGSVNIGINGNFAPWVGTVIKDISSKILVVADDDKLEEVIIRLARVGYDNCIGHLRGGFETWKQAGKKTDKIRSVSVDEFIGLLKQDITAEVLDVRKKSEYDSEHIIGAKNFPLDRINDGSYSIDKNKTYFVHCAGGYRSMIFVSIFRKRGHNNLINIESGFADIRKTGRLKVTEYRAPVTML